MDSRTKRLRSSFRLSIGTLLATAILGLSSFLGVSVYQAMHTFPHGCTQFETGTTFAGYHCGSHTYYVPQQ